MARRNKDRLQLSSPPEPARPPVMKTMPCRATSARANLSNEEKQINTIESQGKE